MPADQVTAVAVTRFERRRGGAAIVDFIPILAYRMAKTELAIGRGEREHLAAA